MSPTSTCPVLSPEPDLDVPSLRAAVAGGIPHVSALGSRRTQARRASALVQAGLDEAELGRIHGPIGLDLDARTR
ncbi:XdhC family protein [Streptomyces sp. NPDC058371]|uniref:XdhC family protein n=1 Tax=Streptomyces sp. NPDC058371 TaxID=3346463 RepID=UPI0036494060